MVCIKCSTDINISSRRDFTNLCRSCYQIQYRAQNKQKIIKLNRDWYLANREKDNKDSIAYQLKRLQVDVQYRVLRRLRSRLNHALKGNWKSGSAIKDLGCTVDQLKLHLESKFQPGMSWDNYGKSGWHIDHIKPLSSFNLQDRVQLQQAVHYTNLQPLWASDNLKKGAKYAT